MVSFHEIVFERVAHITMKKTRKTNCKSSTDWEYSLGGLETRSLKRRRAPLGTPYRFGWQDSETNSKIMTLALTTMEVNDNRVQWNERFRRGVWLERHNNRFADVYMCWQYLWRNVKIEVHFRCCCRFVTVFYAFDSDTRKNYDIVYSCGLASPYMCWKHEDLVSLFLVRIRILHQYHLLKFCEHNKKTVISWNQTCLV